MVTSYYIMQMTNKKNINTEEYYSGLDNAPKLAVFDGRSKCRVCFHDGEISISSIQNVLNITEALKVFGGINMNEEEENRRFLCNVCHKFLKSAILFRKIAHRTTQTLKQSLTLNYLEQNQPDEFTNTFEHDKLNQNSCDDDIITLKFESPQKHQTLKQVKLKPPETSDEKKSNVNWTDDNFILQKRPKGPKVQCPTCKKMFSRAYYRIHVTMHNPSLCGRYVCDICGKAFRLRDSHYRHRIQHKTDYCYKCQLCPFKSRDEYNLKRHMRSHIRDYKYVCAECSAKFIFKSNLNSHILRKHTVPQFKCDSCDKAFHTKLKVQKHYDVVHLGIRNHACNTCGHVFGYRNDLVKHQRRVHKREKLKLIFKKSNYKLLNSS